MREPQRWLSSCLCSRTRPSPTARTTLSWSLASSESGSPQKWFFIRFSNKIHLESQIQHNNECFLLRHNPSCAEALLSCGVSTNNKELCEKTFMLVYNLRLKSLRIIELVKVYFSQDLFEEEGGSGQWQEHADGWDWGGRSRWPRTSVSWHIGHIGMLSRSYWGVT